AQAQPPVRGARVAHGRGTGCRLPIEHEVPPAAGKQQVRVLLRVGDAAVGVPQPVVLGEAAQLLEQLTTLPLSQAGEKRTRRQLRRAGEALALRPEALEEVDPRQGLAWPPTEPQAEGQR